MDETFLRICEWLEATAVSVAIRESSWASGALASTHIIALTLSIGFLVWFDLRLLGVSLKSVPVSRVFRRVMPFAAVGFVIMFITGGLLLSAFATLVYQNPYFKVKFAAMGVAGLNAGFYHANIERRIAEWDSNVQTPPLARMAGIVSLAMWTIVILAGRVMSVTLLAK